MARRRQRSQTRDETARGPDEPTAPSVEPDESEAFGPWLRRQREGREIELREISESSKISLGYLQALEQGRFDVLPAPVFTKGFLRQYAGYVGLDPEEVINAYLAARQAQEDSDEPRFDPQPRRGGSRGARNLRYVLVVLLVAALLVALVWFLGQRRELQDAAVDAPLGASPSTAAPAPATLGTGDGVDASDGSGVSVDGPTADGALGASDAADTSADVRPLDGPPLQVVLDFRGDCWVDARLDGDRRIAELHVQGESLRLEAEEWIDLRVGDHTVVDVALNGRPFDIATRGDGNGSVREVRFEVPDSETDSEADLDTVVAASIEDAE